MGVRELRDAFQEVIGSEGSVVKALLEYERIGMAQTEYQVLYFSGNYANGSGFSIKSDRVGKDGDILAEARATAGRLLSERSTT